MSETTDPAAKLFEQLGRALSSWQNIEQCLGMIFFSLLHTTSSQLAEIVFSCMGFQLKLRAIEQLYQYLVKNPEKLAEWKKLRRHLEKLYKDRNKLAHWQVVNVNFKGMPEGSKTILTHTFTDLRFVDLSKHGTPGMFIGAMDEKDIAETQKKFIKAWSRVMDMMTEVLKQFPPPTINP